jgi:hypothetical protein
MNDSISTVLKAIDFSNHIKQLEIGFQGRSHILHKIDQWLMHKNQRFFILAGEPGIGKSSIAAHLIQTRKDIIVAHHFCQLGKKDTVYPSTVLRSIAAQLAQAFPHYSEALLNTIKPTLSGEVNINIGKIEDLEGKIQSTVQRFKIEKLNPSDIANELDILIRAPLAALPNLYEKNGETPPEFAVILIDGLDIAVATPDGVHEDEDLVTLFAALSEDESLPTWIKFLFTTRPDRRVLREFEPLKPYLINEMDRGNHADLSRYVEQRISSMALATADSQGMIKQLIDRAQGKFRYIKCLLNDLAAGHCTWNDLSSIPLDLAQSYKNDLEQRFLEESGDSSAQISCDRHYKILGTLAAAEHPLTEDILAELTQISPRQLRQDLWGIRQFLDVELVRFCGTPERTRDSYETFTLFHHTLKEYLKQRSAPANLSTPIDH